MQIIPARKTFSSELGLQIGGGLGKVLSDRFSDSEEKQLLRKKMKSEDVKIRMNEAKIGKTEAEKSFFDQLMSESGGEEEPQQESPSIEDMGDEELPKKKSKKNKVYSDNQIAAASLVNPSLAREMRASNDSIQKKENAEQKKNESERKFHTSYSQKQVEKVDEQRMSIPKLEMSLDLARNAVESDEVGALSLANIGKRLGIPELQTMKGAQLITAAKENLLGNMSRVSARAQNIWFEQRLNSMFAQIGQSKEANLAAQEILEGEVSMSKAYINEFDRLSEEDTENYGYERKDIAKRARKNSEILEKHIMQRTSYRLKELEEQEKGLADVKKLVGKNVIKGTPLTLAMAKLYKEKFGDKAIDVAEKNGYYIPTLDEFKSYQQRPREFREDL